LASALARSEDQTMNQGHIDATINLAQQFAEEMSAVAVWDETFSAETGKAKEKDGDKDKDKEKEKEKVAGK